MTSPMLVSQDSMVSNKIDITKLQINYKYLLTLTLTMGCSIMNFGFALCAVGESGVALEEQLNWGTTKKERDKHKTFLGTVQVLGIAFGSVTGGGLLKYGKRKIILIMNLFNIAGCLMRIWPNFPLILIGSFIQGFAAGVHVSACPKIVDETVPYHVNDKGFGASTNILANLAIMINMLLGFGLPKAEDIPHLKTT